MNEHDDQHSTEDQADGQSKSARKREMQRFRELGEQLMALPRDQLASIPLSEESRQAMALYRRLKHGEARRRQLRYIGKLLSQEDGAALDDALENLRLRDKMYHRLDRQAEQWRDDLLKRGDEAVFELLERHPDLDRQHLRQLLRQAQREGHDSNPSRKLFRLLRDSLTPA